MDTELVVGVDLGTTTLKGGLFDLGGEVHALAEASYPISRPQPDAAEQDAAWWMGALEDVLRQLQAQAPGRRAAAIGVCSQVNTHVFLDEHQNPLRPAILGQDQRAGALSAELNTLLAGRAPAKTARFSFAASSHVSRAEWLARNEPELWERTRYVVSPKDYVTTRLCDLRAPVTDAITPFDLVDESGAYDGDVVGLVDGLAERLPRIARPTSRPYGHRAAPERVVLDVTGHRGRHRATPGGGGPGTRLATGRRRVLVRLP